MASESWTGEFDGESGFADAAEAEDGGGLGDGGGSGTLQQFDEFLKIFFAALEEITEGVGGDVVDIIEGGGFYFIGDFGRYGNEVRFVPFKLFFDVAGEGIIDFDVVLQVISKIVLEFFEGLIGFGLGGFQFSEAVAEQGEQFGESFVVETVIQVGDVDLRLLVFLVGSKLVDGFFDDH